MLCSKVFERTENIVCVPHSLIYASVSSDIQAKILSQQNLTNNGCAPSSSIYFMKLIPVLQKQQKLYQLAGFVVLLGAPCLIPAWKRDVVMNNLTKNRNRNWNIHLTGKTLVFWKSSTEFYVCKSSKA